MALFSRRKNTPSTPDASVAPEESAATVEAEEQAAQTPAEPVPHVNISVSSFGGLGAGAPQPKPAAQPAQPAAVPVVAPGHNADGTVALPFAADEPPTDLETVPGLRDNAVLRDALARLGEGPTGAELLGVFRQALQGHLFLRVKGDARQQVEAGEDLQLGVIRNGDENYMLAFSSGRALQQAVEADGDTGTSAIGQPAALVLRHVLANDFAGLVIDNFSGTARAVVPRDLIERVMGECDPTFSVKSLIAGERTEETPAAVVEALREGRVWVAVGRAGDNEDGTPRFGVAEAHTSDGRRLLQLFTHPLEVVALGRGEQAAPFAADALVKALADNSGVSGVILDPAGPNLRLTREQLAPLLTPAS